MGFEVDIADAIARELGVEARQVQNAWDSLIPSLQRGDFDFVMNGMEITPQRSGNILFSSPYYVYTEQLAVGGDDTRIKDAYDLKGKKVGSLSGAVAQDILTSMENVDTKVKGTDGSHLSLGMPQNLAIKRIVMPQAMRIALPGITNDFIALFKDSSLVSVIAMVELTKTYSILAATTSKFFELGLIVAILYFAMSYPLSLLARRLEERLKGTKK